MKVRPSQISTIALMAGLPFASRVLVRMPSRTACDKALTGGELIVMTPISPSTVSVAIGAGVVACAVLMAALLMAMIFE